MFRRAFVSVWRKGNVKSPVWSLHTHVLRAANGMHIMFPVHRFSIRRSCCPCSCLHWIIKPYVYYGFRTIGLGPMNEKLKGATGTSKRLLSVHFKLIIYLEKNIYWPTLTFCEHEFIGIQVRTRVVLRMLPLRSFALIAIPNFQGKVRRPTTTRMYINRHNMLAARRGRREADDEGWGICTANREIGWRMKRSFVQCQISFARQTVTC
jgi:hypothetical protein